ncbi:MAG TPA: hypothetical protein VF807_02450 [Ktedonobacterales bacterium]
MQFTTVRVERPEGTPVAHGLAVQIETARDVEALTDEASRAVDLVWVYTTQGVPVLPLRRRDVLFDELLTDPETGQSAKYRLVGAVETFDDHQEALAERVVGA